MADLAARTAPSRVGPERPDPSVGRARIRVPSATARVPSATARAADDDPRPGPRRAPTGPIDLTGRDEPRDERGDEARAERTTPTRIVEIRSDRARERDDLVVGEEPLAIRACGPGQAPIEVAVTMRTPGDEVDLALGFLFTEGLIEGEDVIAVSFGDPGRVRRPDDEVTVHLKGPLDLGRVAERRFVATAACGICGKASIEEVALRCEPPPPGRPVVPVTVLGRLPQRLRAAQVTFELTGGLHAAALFRPDGELVALREDVGRHNALDKLIGSQLRLGRLPLHDAVLLVSGRVSFEIVQKAAAAGIPIVGAISAPSDLAVEAARALGLTLVGFLRDGRANVYAGLDRVRLDGPGGSTGVEPGSTLASTSDRSSIPDPPLLTRPDR